MSDDEMPRAVSRAWLIDAAQREIKPVTVRSLADLQALVGGYIEVACEWPDTGDVLYVDEEGLLKDPKHFFMIPRLRPDQALAGNGLVVGKELDERGTLGNVAITEPALRKMIKFLKSGG